VLIDILRRVAAAVASGLAVVDVHIAIAVRRIDCLIYRAVAGISVDVCIAVSGRASRAAGCVHR